MALQFDSKMDGFVDPTIDTVIKAGQDVLVRLSSTEDGYTIGYMNDALRVTVDKATIIWYRNHEPHYPDEEKILARQGFRVEGEPAAHAAYLKHPATAELPHVSRALGAEGITGAYPAAMVFHQLALRVSTELNIAVAPLPNGQVGHLGQPGRLGPTGQLGQTPTSCVAPPDCWPDCDLPGCGDGRCVVGEWCRICPEDCGECPPPPPPHCRAGNPCRDLRSDPCDNDCLGMCGPGCSCWSWVCGDCCYHSGCNAHDRACRSCSIWPWTWGNCVICYSPLALIVALLGC